MFSLTGEYALRAAIYLAQNADHWPLLGKDIARETGIPVKYLSKILSDLVREGVLEASRGRKGGFRMTRPAAQVTLMHVLTPFEQFEQKRCPFGNHACGEETACLAHDQWVKVRAVQMRFLATTSVQEVAVERRKRRGWREKEWQMKEHEVRSACDGGAGGRARGCGMNRRGYRGKAAAVGTAALVVAVGWWGLSAFEIKAQPAPSQAKPATGTSTMPAVEDLQLARGADLYVKHCTVCHGNRGDGLGKFAYLMNPRPRDFRQGKFKLGSTQSQIPTNDDLLRTISRGMPGSAMPPWGHLPLSDLQALVKFVRQVHIGATRLRLEKEVAEGSRSRDALDAELGRLTEPGQPLVIPPEPPFDDLRWFRGRSVYLEACASCHGADGQPVPESVKYDAEGYPVPPRSFVNGIFKGGSEGHQLYARIVKGIAGTPMPAYAGIYSDDDIWNLIHYVQSLSRAGAQDRAQLRQGTIVAPNIRAPLPEGPMDSAWDRARPAYVALTPLWWTEDRVEGLVVQALHNDADLAIRLSWIDPTLDERGVRHDEFRDAVAIQFSMSSDPPFYMGDSSQHGGVNIWMWKADRQKNIAAGYQDVDAAFPHRAVDLYPEQNFKLTDMSVVEWPRGAITEHNPQFVSAWGAGNLVADPTLKTPVECLVARGPGTLSGKPANVQLVRGQAEFQRGVWYVQLQRTLDLPHAHEEADERAFKAGDYLPVSFAIWNGSAGDRDGKKNISIWQKLVIE